VPAQIVRAIAGLVTVEDGLYQPTVKAPLAEPERQKARARSKAPRCRARTADVNSNIAAHDHRKVERLAEALAEDPSSREAAIALRSSIAKSCSSR
jgi:hypothetical protein